MSAKERYRVAMEWLYVACVATSGIALVLITLMIPYGVFMRYVMRNAQSWPEPGSVVLMVLFTFLGGAAVYRAGMHVAVEALSNAVGPTWRLIMQRLVLGCMLATSLFMVVYGTQLCLVTRFQSIAEFPWLSVAVVYLPIPVAGVITLLFLLERTWVGSPPKTSVMYQDEATALE